MSNKEINNSLVKAYNHMTATYDKNRDDFDMTIVLNDFYECLEMFLYLFGR